MNFENLGVMFGITQHLTLYDLNHSPHVASKVPAPFCRGNKDVFVTKCE